MRSRPGERLARRSGSRRREIAITERSEQSWEWWGPLAERYRERRPRKILALDGGGKLERTLKDTFGEKTDLSPENLRCLLTVVARNATTDSAWPISSNPFAQFNDPALGDCKLRVPLWKLVRTSTATPVYFPPEVIEWDLNDASKSFVLMSQVSVDQDVSCRVVGRCTYGGVLDVEIHDLIPSDPGIPEQPLSLDTDLGKAFLYVRYDVELTPNGLADLEIHDLDAERLRAMDDVANLEDLARVGSTLRERVNLGHLGSFV